MTNLYMLDTNIASYAIKKNTRVKEKLLEIPLSNICISVITEAELLFGVAKKLDCKNLELAVKTFLQYVDILEWTSSAAECYASLRFECEKTGLNIGNLDMLIAAHAISSNSTLVSNDKIFCCIKGLKLENWLL